MSVCYRKRRRAVSSPFSSSKKSNNVCLDTLSKELEDEMTQALSSFPSSPLPPVATPSPLLPRTIFLDNLPTDVLLRVMAFLRSRDVCVVAVVCRSLCSLCKSRELWSTLYVRRWPVYSAAQDLSGAQWREKYRRKHLAEIHQMSKGCPPELLHYFLQMEQAKINLKKRDFNEFDIIERWLDKHPVARHVTPLQRQNHLCSKQTCKYYNVNELYICEQTGKIHFCGLSCNEQLDDGDLITCGVSGRTFHSETDQLGQDSGVKIGIAVGMEGSEDVEEDDDDGDSFLAKCYSYGYSCSSEMEYQRVLDVVLPP